VSILIAIIGDAGASSRALQGVAKMSHMLHISALFQVSGTLHNPPALMHARIGDWGVPCEVSLSAAS
jgi:hypothetical protein